MLRQVDRRTQGARSPAGPWRLLRVLWIVPRPLRDALYSFIARNRYRFFGKRQACLVPTPAQRKLFLDQA